MFIPYVRRALGDLLHLQQTPAYISVLVTSPIQVQLVACCHSLYQVRTMRRQRGTVLGCLALVLLSRKKAMTKMTCNTAMIGLDFPLAVEVEHQITTTRLLPQSHNATLAIQRRSICLADLHQLAQLAQLSD